MDAFNQFRFRALLEAAISGGQRIEKDEWTGEVYYGGFRVAEIREKSGTCGRMGEGRDAEYYGSNEIPRRKTRRQTFRL